MLRLLQNVLENNNNNDVPGTYNSKYNFAK
jgi:hypothetical protein